MIMIQNLQAFSGIGRSCYGSSTHLSGTNLIHDALTTTDDYGR